MLALTELKYRQIVPGMFDVDIDTECEDSNRIYFSVHRLYADSERGYMFSQLGLEDSYVSVGVDVPSGIDMATLSPRTWIEVSATALRDENCELYSEVPDWARQALRDAVEVAVARQMIDLRGQSNPRNWFNE